MKRGGVVLLIVLLIIGNIYFWSGIIGDNSSGTITGMAVSDEDSTEGVNYLFPILLILVIIANILYLVSGRGKKKTKKPGNLEDILDIIKKMDIKHFREHVNSDVNDIADMVRRINPELAVKLYDITDKSQMIHIIQQHIGRVEEAKTQEQLRKEILELKHELDTFDFGGFEKDL